MENKNRTVYGHTVKYNEERLVGDDRSVPAFEEFDLKVVLKTAYQRQLRNRLK